MSKTDSKIKYKEKPVRGTYNQSDIKIHVSIEFLDTFECIADWPKWWLMVRSAQTPFDCGCEMRKNNFNCSLVEKSKRRMVATMKLWSRNYNFLFGFGSFLPFFVIYHNDQYFRFQLPFSLMLRDGENMNFIGTRDCCVQFAIFLPRLPFLLTPFAQFYFR